MTSSEVAITNLLYRYTELMDAGALEEVAELFRHAQVHMQDKTVGADGVLQTWRDSVILYADGTPRTKHVVTNAIVEVDEFTGTGTCRSYYTVLQQTDDFPLQVIIAGRYHDRFEKVEGHWRFAERDYSLVDLVGDLSHHLRIPVAKP